MKRLFAGIIAMMMIFAMSGCGSSKMSDSTAEATTQNTGADVETVSNKDVWINEVLEDEKTKAEYPYYRVVDFNNDEKTALLFLSTTEDHFIGAEQKACLKAFVNGEIVTLQEIGGAGGEYWFVHPSDKTLVYYSRLSGESHITVYKYEDGKLVPVTTADSYGPHHYPEEDTDESVYLIDKKKVSKEELEKVWDDYANENNVITYEKY